MGTATYRTQSHELWQQMATRWEHGRGVLAETFRPTSEWLVDHADPRPGQTLLDVAAGTGETGFLAAPRLGDHGRLICSDFAPNMLAAAERLAAQLGIANAEFRVLDAEELELEDDSVDGVVCRFGYMLMADPGRALREARRVLRPGGRLAFAVFAEPQRNPWMTVPRGVMAERGHLDPPDPRQPGLFSLSDAARLSTLVEAAGFSGVEVEELAVTFRFADADALWSYTTELQGPIALALARLGDAERSEVRAAIEAGHAPSRTGDGYALPGAVLAVTAD